MVNFETDNFSLIYRGNNKFDLYTDPSVATFYYPNKKINLLTNVQTKSSTKSLLTIFKKKQLTKKFDKEIIHLSYESGFVFTGNDHLLRNDQLLAIVLKYKKRQRIDLKKIKNLSMPELTLMKTIKMSQYKKSFNEVYKHLNLGNCYQVNLTSNFKMSFDQNASVEKFLNFFKKAKIAEMAHCTYIISKKLMILSNSPEVLFKIKGDKVFSYPIKGTVRLESSNKKLFSKKNLGELNMISDLVRNDLTKFSMNPSTVVKKNEVLYVSKVKHLYSEIFTKFKNKNLENLLRAIFPGGSITGAPKKRVIEIIKKIERDERGFYCGSTIVLDQKIKSASINIRTAQIDFKNKILTYGSGGGITLLSSADDEFSEMKSKFESFFSYFPHIFLH